MKVLVIGGTGLISGPVAQSLLDRGDAVTILTRGRSPCTLRGDVGRLTGDRADRPAFERLLAESGTWDAVIDMICSEPEDAASLARALAGRTAQLLFCGTTNVYPKPADRYPVPESHRLGAAYKNGIDKARCEAIHRAAESAGAYRLTVIRPGHTYGEGGGVLNSLAAGASFLDRIRAGRPIVVHGDGQGLWSALHADDVARLFAAAAGRPAAFGKTYHATGTEWMTWDQYHARLAEAVDAVVPERIHIPAEWLARLAPARAGHVLRSLQYPGIYDMTAARTDLGFADPIPFVEGMRRVVRRLERDNAIDPWTTDPEYDRILHDWQRALSALTGTQSG